MGLGGVVRGVRRKRNPPAWSRSRTGLSPAPALSANPHAASRNYGHSNCCFQSADSVSEFQHFIPDLHVRLTDRGTGGAAIRHSGSGARLPAVPERSPGSQTFLPSCLTPCRPHLLCFPKFPNRHRGLHPCLRICLCGDWDSETPF